MTAAGRGFLVLILVALALTQLPAGSPLPPNPHLPMSASGACAGCHAYYGGTLDPREFVVAIPEKCWVCHSKKDLGRSHPIGVDPNHSTAQVEIPADLPLEDGKVSCGTCHNPHMAFLSETRTFPAQEVSFLQVEAGKNIAWYKTFFLRKSDPDKGFEPLCRACHTDY